ncbi:Pls/PosA family non-ribosomal peptide synthetase [Xylanimonas protaetiae]|uniref:Amino acid adenylation domain-containing protein n=1 Tax=Xylanimonas protaetiae TaxID=2509457 RepID=A0A4P6FH00_9MICO|nr:Pls/PosA family non-ribosomal peptide synthetase [Xylanimonas protaetiae]QAY69888.1 amino acid adenylation domain-containing protein [Xylanimonas protaetiae]
MPTLSPLLAGDRAATPRTLVELLAATAAAHPDAPAIDDGVRAWSYAEVVAEVTARARALADAGVRRGDRVGVRATSGRADLYLAILAVLHAGAAYVPVDRDDPEERAELVFGEAGVVAVVGDDGAIDVPTAAPPAARVAGAPGLDDVAWIIFTSGSTGVPKGVAVTHRSAAAFVDAEARLFLQADPLGPGDRVLAGLSVAFDASCEEMWLAWRHGACLVPADRALVRTGLDLGPWVAAQGITAISTVPTLAGLLPAADLARVRLLIFGGESVPPELATRLAADGREVWNTYGPTEATVVACAAILDGVGPVRIGLPLDGWDLVVVDEAGEPVPEGAAGELVIGGVGLGRYLDPAKDAEKYAPLPSLGWERAYRSGDLVVNDPAGLLFLGRADDQVKVGGRRIELGELDAALLASPQVEAAAAAVRTTAAGNKVIVGYVVPSHAPSFDAAALTAHLREVLPAALVPLLGVVGEIPTRTSGKVDRDALPWPLPGVATPSDDDVAALADPVQEWVAEVWGRVLGVPPTSADDDFFDLGGGSLTAAQVVSAVRERYPLATVADLYANPTVADLATFLQVTYGAGDDDAAAPPPGTPTPRGTQAFQVVALILLRLVAGLRWATWAAIVVGLLRLPGDAWLGPGAERVLASLPAVSWPWLVVAWLLLVAAPGRLALAAGAARLLLRGVGPGDHPRGGSAHRRLWLAEQLVEALGGITVAAAPLVGLYARALGARIGRGVDLHTLPPVTGLLTVGDRAAVEPEVDLSGHWLEGDVLHVGRVVVGADATVGARSVLLPGAHVGRGTDIAAGSAVVGGTGTNEYWEGSPATRRRSEVKHPWPDERPARGGGWVLAYQAGGVLLGLQPVLALAAGVLVLLGGAGDAATPADALRSAAAWLPVAILAAFAAYAVLTVVLVRLLALGMRAGFHPVRSRTGWQAWCTERVMDAARTVLFPLYSSIATPAWLRLLGARMGRHVEASTVVGIPTMMEASDGAFLADDTMVAPYELGGGWLRVAPAKVGRRAFLGNSGITAPGRSVPKNGLVAVLSAAPHKAKKGSSWIGSPPVLLPRTVGGSDDEGLTYEPPARLRWARGGVEVLRLTATVVSGALGAGVVVAVLEVAHLGGWGLGALAAGGALVVAALVAAAVTTGAKRLLVGRFDASEHPLWSSFVWRNELADTFTEVVAAPWFTNHVLGTPVLTAWLRTMGAHIGRGVWLETYWLPEGDLVTLDDGAAVGRGTVLQTHLFHDRVMSLDGVRVEAGATVGPHSVVLPAARLGAGTVAGPASLVMRGEVLPQGSRWQGNPVAPWAARPTARDR